MSTRQKRKHQDDRGSRISALHDRRALILASSKQNPITAWSERNRRRFIKLTYERGTISRPCSLSIARSPRASGARARACRMAIDRVLDRARTRSAGYSTLKVSHANGKPILFLPTGPEPDDLSEGWTDVLIDGEPYSANFVRVAINVVRRPGAGERASAILRQALVRPGRWRAWCATRWPCSRWLRNGNLPPLKSTRRSCSARRSYSREETPLLFEDSISTSPQSAERWVRETTWAHLSARYLG